MKYKVRYLEDFLTIAKEVILECDSDKEEDIKKAVDNYYENNLSHLEEIAGAIWIKVEDK